MLSWCFVHELCWFGVVNTRTVISVFVHEQRWFGDVSHKKLLSRCSVSECLVCLCEHEQCRLGVLCMNNVGLMM